ncbi:mCG148473 [Mus musculus]|nr:mCG148473 [Mus musculus]
MKMCFVLLTMNHITPTQLFPNCVWDSIYIKAQRTKLLDNMPRNFPLLSMKPSLGIPIPVQLEAPISSYISSTKLDISSWFTNEFPLAWYFSNSK